MRSVTEILVPPSGRGQPAARFWRGAAFVAGTVLTSALVAGRFSPAPGLGRVRRFYRRLDKPEFTPPDPVFGIWGPLYGAIAVAGMRLWNSPASPARDRAVSLWTISQALMALWMWAGFGARRLGVATAIAAGNVAITAAYADQARRVDRPAALLTLPLLGWLGFAAALQEELWRRNR